MLYRLTLVFLLMLIVLQTSCSRRKRTNRRSQQQSSLCNDAAFGLVPKMSKLYVSELELYRIGEDCGENKSCAKVVRGDKTLELYLQFESKEDDTAKQPDVVLYQISINGKKLFDADRPSELVDPALDVWNISPSKQEVISLDESTNTIRVKAVACVASHRIHEDRNAEYIKKANNEGYFCGAEVERANFTIPAVGSKENKDISYVKVLLEKK